MKLVAVDGPVRIFKAFEAPIIPAGTDDISVFLRGVLSSVLAIRGRAPFSLFVNVNERLLEVVLIFLKRCLVTKFLE